MGLVECIFTASDLSTLSPTNRLWIYAEDTYLLVPAVNPLTIPQELQHISDWAMANSLQLNNAKSQETIVHYSERKKHLTLATLMKNEIPSIKRVETSISANADRPRDAASRKIDDHIALPTKYNYQATSVGR